MSLLITERLSLERAVVAASKARSAAAATTVTAAPPSHIESAMVAGRGSGASVDTEKQLELMTKRYESQVHAIRTQVRVTLQHPVLR